MGNGTGAWDDDTFRGPIGIPIGVKLAPGCCFFTTAVHHHVVGQILQGSFSAVSKPIGKTYLPPYWLPAGVMILKAE